MWLQSPRHTPPTFHPPAPLAAPLPNPLTSLCHRRTRCIPLTSSASASAQPPKYDAVVIGSGLGGLSAAALLSTAGRSVCVLEAHADIGGAAHAFKRHTPAGIFTFVSGPHLFSGLSSPSSTSSSTSHNPMRDVLLACGATTQVHIEKYPSWGVLLNHDDPVIESSVLRSRPFLDNLFSQSGTADVQRLLDAVLPLGDVATTLSPSWLRLGDVLGSLRVAVPRAASTALPALWAAGLNTARLLDPFEIVLRTHVKDRFAYDFINLVCFLLAGVEADRIPTAEVAYLLREWVPPKGVSSDVAPGSRDDCVLEHISSGGVSALADALAHSITDGVHLGSSGEETTSDDDTTLQKSVVRTNALVSSVIVNDATGKAVGVQLSSGERVYATHVISNASAWDVSSLLPEPWKSRVDAQVSKMDRCASFMHINVALPKLALSSHTVSKLLPNYVVVRDFTQSLDTPGNVTLVSVPSIVDPSVCPSDYVVAHAYLPATEPFEPWADLDTKSDEYRTMKRQRAKPLWEALQRVFEIDDVEKVVEVAMVGTPRTHARFLHRKYGTYGPRVDARGKGMGIGIPFPGDVTVPRMMHCVGDGVFPGIGVPAVAASAWLVVNGILSVAEQERLLERVERNGK